MITDVDSQPSAWISSALAGYVYRWSRDYSNPGGPANAYSSPVLNRGRLQHDFRVWLLTLFTLLLSPLFSYGYVLASILANLISITFASSDISGLYSGLRATTSRNGSVESASTPAV